jgi:thiol-disulfide isomerase/thioredoxin
MSTDVPTPPGAPEPSPGVGPPDAGQTLRKPRKRFLVIGTGLGLVAVLLFGIFTSIGSSTGSGNGGGTSGAPHEGGPVPAFSGTNIGPVGPATVRVPAGGTGTPTVLLFFGAWCTACHQELPSLAAAVRTQNAAGGPLSHIKVLGVDSLDKTSAAQNFVRTVGVGFPVAYDPNDNITSGDFLFTGDPYAVFVNADGSINRIVRGDVLTPASFTADEQVLLRSAHTTT